MILSKQISIAALFFLFASHTQAALIDENINGELIAAGVALLIDQDSVVIDPGVEFLFNGAGPISADFSDSSLNLNIGLASGSLPLSADILWAFTLNNPDLIFTSVVETFDDFVAGSTFDGIFNAGKTIAFTITDQTITAPGHSASYDITIASTSSAVPVPGAIWLLGSGLMGLVGMRKRSVKQGMGKD